MVKDFFDKHIEVMGSDKKVNAQIKKKVKSMLSQMPSQKKYKTNCFMCGREFITRKNTANEGICYDCRIK